MCVAVKTRMAVQPAIFQEEDSHLCELTVCGVGGESLLIFMRSRQPVRGRLWHIMLLKTLKREDIHAPSVKGLFYVQENHYNSFFSANGTQMKT